MNDDEVVLARESDELTFESTVDDPRLDALTLVAKASAPTALDGLTRIEVEALVREALADGLPVRFSLSRTGEVTFEPVDPGDRVFDASFNDGQRRTIDDGRLEEPDAASTLIDLFRTAGWSVRVADSRRVLDGSDPRPAAEWLARWVARAVEHRPALREWADEYLQTRRAQLAAGSLRIVVHQQEFLAWAP